jgi:hypothetical protein
MVQGVVRLAERPKLPLIAQADIENAREKALRLLLAASPMLFDQTKVIPLSPIRMAEAKPANLILELQLYTRLLFDAEANVYRQEATTETEFHEWLNDLASCMKSEVMRDIQPFSAIHNFHCSPAKRLDAIDQVLRQCVDYWIARPKPKQQETLSESEQEKPLLLLSSGAADDETGRRRIEREALRDAYLTKFPEKPFIMDICWAARQHYREWTRWISGYSKDKSKPAVAFRAIVQSNRRPEEHRPEPRPKDWE